MIVRQISARLSSGIAFGTILLAAGMLALPMGPATGQTTDPSTGHIVSQPARDVGLAKTTIPPLLVKVSENPYTTEGAGTCAQISSSIAALTAVIGTDFTASPAHNKKNVAKMGGAAVVNSLIPFRGVVRVVSGANAAEERKNAAIDAGIARRGFLHGLKIARKCG